MFYPSLFIYLDLEVLQVLVLLELVRQLVEEALDLALKNEKKVNSPSTKKTQNNPPTVLGGHLGPVHGLEVLRGLGGVGQPLLQLQVGGLEVGHLLGEDLHLEITF